MIDQFQRPLHDLRISVTDRCNFRCVYCMPKEVFGKDFAFMERDELLSFEEMTRLARISVAHGVEKIRLTGGEPLLRKGIEELVAMLAALRTPDGRPIDIAMTTNGSVLALKARALKDAGLKRVTVSLDSLDDATFRAMNDVKFPVAKVLNSLDVAHSVGLGPIKINMVLKRGQNDQDIVAMARHFKGTPYILRFIEFMDVGSSNGWEMGDVVPSAEVVARINAELPLEEVAPNKTGETSRRWRYRDGEGEIGVISSVTQSFCHSCSRARVSTDGKLFTCLFATEGHDLRALMRGGCTDEQLTEVLKQIWRERTDRYSELRSAETGRLRASGKKRIEMSYIGG
ncbi:GTP 3',8-cyclase MoaA [Cryobacterium sp. TMT1-62]|uniref:GTP 3',8-cyclase n=1 Tax=Cryobacterium sandaracinum TaxID=1259247 RepID=A0ABY2JA27_9MICO|nr:MULTISPECIES: GTP 3',8-cyclase MoaA [Cryobacterium]TFB59452.1 GTP 3',8-cyclase MoaA [Cryobacterium sp. Hz7]TFB60545.1 GTP 3',8-cyclase MoaA [Cryobacterium sp. Sr3]TFC66947.1 GTP 3',8-cyclase MoaA [Cryobacterium sp. TMT2-4]TFD01203.1 GTP 3',8-cyclase MoaA [Cryobacterium sandaracinum]TFD35267.1 GTP 3',8-cyclase MoaA [Cryobacterium sp. TMT1-62]